MKDRLPNIYRGAALAGSLALAGCAGSGAGAEPIQDVSYRNSDYKIVAGSLASGGMGGVIPGFVCYTDRLPNVEIEKSGYKLSATDITCENKETSGGVAQDHGITPGKRNEVLIFTSDLSITVISQ